MTLAKNLALALASVLVFALLIEGALALVGVEAELVEKDPLVGFSSRVPLYVPAGRPGVLHTAKNKRALFNFHRFERSKPEGTVRVFCMGGSTTYGRPYGDRTSFCGWLREFLPVADPTRQWELLNAGGISYASYRVAAVMEELAEYEPDLFIVYTGHNEFLEARTYGELLEASGALLETRAVLNRTRTYTALKRVVEKVRGREVGEMMQKDVLPGEVDAVLDDSVGLQAYHRDDEWKQGVLAHLRINLNRMVDIAESADAQSLFVTPASNLRNCSPFKSERRAGMSESERLAFDDELAKARRRFARRRFARALEAVDAAIQHDARHPAAQYLRGQILYASARYDAAREAFQRALDEDICPLRALSETLQTVSDVARERGVPVIEWARHLQARAENGITGEDFFLDHVHPTIEGNRMLALLLIEQFHASGRFEYGPDWNESAIASISERLESSLDATAHARALTNLAKVFGWAGKTEEAHELALRALETVGDAETYNNAAMNALRLGRIEEAIGFYHKVIEQKPKHAPALSDLGYALAQLERYDEAIVYLRRSIALQNDNERSRYNLGHVLALQGHYAEAISELRAALRINPSRGEYHVVLGNVHVEQGNAKQALRAYDRAIELNSRMPKAYYRRSQVHQELGNTANAVADLRAAVELVPGSPNALVNLALILATDADPELRDGAAAIAYARTAVRLTKRENADALGALAAGYAEQGVFEEAVVEARNAIEVTDPVDSTALDQARVHLAGFEAGKPRRATP
jgi:tetratricopeptide (TPR) repeat protein